jgi:long-chain fatty acid transport protein
MRASRPSISILAAAALLAGASAARGAGFAIIEQSVRNLGNAFAGATADPEDTAAIYWNAAGIAFQAGTHVSVGAHAILPSFEFDGASSYPLFGNLPVSGNEGGDAGVDSYVPNFYLVHQINERINVGLGLHAPFGLAVEYDDGWVGRYHALKTELITLNINPTVAWKVNDRLALGAGVSAQYAEAEMSQAIDFGTILASQGAGTAPGSLDGKATLEGDDWAYGFNLGVLYACENGRRLGLAYRSAIDHELEGDASFDTPDPARPLQAMGLFRDTGGAADLRLPDTVTAGIYQPVGGSLALLADVAWTQWSRFDELRVRYGSNQPDSVTEENWDDSFRYAVGLNYFVDPQWTLRCGLAYDETPVPDKEHRTPRIPDADRRWVTAGFGYRATENVSLDFGYVHLFFNDSEIEQIGPSGDRLVGEYQGDVDIVSFQVNWRI